MRLLNDEEMKEAVLHDIKLEGQYCVTFREVKGDGETLSFSCYPAKQEAIREISLFKYDDIWRKLANS